MSEGNYNVVLCERGIRTFETATRNTLDVSAVPVVKERSSLPIIIDPSHAAGKSRYIESLSLAGIAAGADGLIIEVHPEPKVAMSDAAQQLTIPEYQALVKKLAQWPPPWEGNCPAERPLGLAAALECLPSGRRLHKAGKFSTGWAFPVENKAALGFPGKRFPGE